MIIAYTPDGKKQVVATEGKIPADGLWLDLMAPTGEEIKMVQKHFGIELPTRDEMSDIQISSQLYTEGDAHVMTTPIIAGAGSESYEVGAMSFVLLPHVLITLRFLEPRAVTIFSEKFLVHPADYASSSQVLLGLFDIFIERSVDVMERIGDQVDKLSNIIFKNIKSKKTNKQDQMHEILQHVGLTGDMLGQLRNAMAGSERVAMFLTSHAENLLGKNGIAHAKIIHRDVHALELHADALQQRIVFLLDATLGMISIEQNKVMTIFTVAAVTLMPPTLLAGIWGMNFHNMPELAWAHGYGVAIIAILASTLAPLLYFRHKGWI